MTFSLVILWALLVAVNLVLSGQPLSADAQTTMSLALFLLLVLLVQLPRRGFLRLLFIGIASFVVMRYLLWRTANTLPPVDDILAFVPGLLLYLAELYAILMFFISLFVVADPLERRLAAIAADSDDLPSVDVFVPTYDEAPHILAATLSAAKRMRYPAELLTVYLLDDGGTDVKLRTPPAPGAPTAAQRAHLLRELCRELGVVYLTRTDNRSAKAGNLNAALPRTKGELIAIFDADHAPTADFLENTVGHFKANPKLFLVQTPHFFINPDPLERNLGTFNAMPGENEMFYGVIQRGLDRWGASFFCGSAAVLRRRALEQVDGFSGRTITEDCETSLELHARGWQSLYVDKPMVAGLQPETFPSFINQRIRWCQGMIQIFALQNPLFKRGLDLGQRLGYASSNLFWFFGLARLTFFLAPLFYLFFGLAIYRATAAEFVAYTIFYLATSLITSSYLFGRTRWPLVSELYEYVQSVFTARAILSVLWRPRAPTFRVTAKGETIERDQLSQLSKPLLTITLLLFLGLIATIWRYWAFPDTREVLLVVGSWNLFALMLSLRGLRVVCERKQARRAPRVQIEEPVALVVEGGPSVPAFVIDASIMGVKVLLPHGAVSEEELRQNPLEIRSIPAPDGAGQAAAAAPASIRLQVRSLRREEEGLALGAEFMTPTPAEYRMIADLIFVSSNRWVAFLESRRQHSPGLVKGLLLFVWLSLTSAVFALRFLLRLQGQATQAFPETLQDNARKPEAGTSRFAQHPMEMAG